MNLMDGLNEICKLASPETLRDQNIDCLFIFALNMEGHGISRVSGHFADIMLILDIIVDYIVEHSDSTLTRDDVIKYLQLCPKKEE